MKIKSMFVGVCAAVALSGPACASYVVDTGAPDGGSDWSLGSFQYFGGEFTLANASLINGIESYFSALGGGGGIMDFAIHADGGNVPGAILFATPSAIAANTALGWHGVSGLNWALGAGTYWVSFHVDDSFSGTMPGYAPNALGEYAQGSGSYAWQDYGANYFDYLGIGVRIDASANAVPEPTTLALVGLSLTGLGVSRRKRAL